MDDFAHLPASLALTALLASIALIDGCRLGLEGGIDVRFRIARARIRMGDARRLGASAGTFVANLREYHKDHTSQHPLPEASPGPFLAKLREYRKDHTDQNPLREAFVRLRSTLDKAGFLSEKPDILLDVTSSLDEAISSLDEVDKLGVLDEVDKLGVLDMYERHMRSIVAIADSALEIIAEKPKLSPEAIAALMGLAQARRVVQTSLNQVQMASEFPALLRRQDIGEFGQHGLIGSRGETVGVSLLSRHNFFQPHDWFSREVVFKQGDFNEMQWEKMKDFFHASHDSIRINLARIPPSIIDEKEWFYDFAKQIMRNRKHKLHTFAPGGRYKDERIRDTCWRYIKYGVLHRGHHVGDLTAAMLFMKMSGNLRSAEKFFFLDIDGASEDIRYKHLGNILGAHATKHLIAKLFFKMNSEEGLQECIAAANLLVGILHGRSAHYLQRMGVQVDSIRELYDFLADVPGAETDVKLNAKRTGVVYGALIAFAMDVKDVNDEKARMLIAGIEASSAILCAVADGAMTALTLKSGSSIIPKVIIEVRDLLKWAVENRNDKVRHATAKWGEAIMTNLIVVLEQNRNQTRIPGLYKEPTDDEFKMFEDEALRVFSAVSQKLIRDSVCRSELPNTPKQRISETVRRLTHKAVVQWPTGN